MKLRSYAMVLAAAFAANACSVPTLEAPECTDSRNAARQFYSFHFGNEMKFSAEGLEERKHFLTPELYEQARQTAGDGDPFTTGTNDVPRAFRLGACTVVSPERTKFTLSLYWKDDDRSQQQNIAVEMERAGDAWLVDKIDR